MITEIYSKVNNCLGEMGIPFTAITDEAHLSKDLSFDSLDIADLIYKLEEVFQINIAESEWQKLQTVGSIKEYLHNQITVISAKNN